MNVFNARAFAMLTLVALAMHAFNADGQTIREFSLPDGSNPNQIVAGPDGNFWFTEQQANRIGIISPDGSLLVERPLPTPNALPFGITVGPDGNLWFVENGAMQIGRMKPDGSVVEFPTRCSPSGYIISGPDKSVWFSETCAGTRQDFIGEVSTGTFAGGIFEHYTGLGKGVRDLVWAPNGNIWFTELQANAIGELDEAGIVIESSVPSVSNLSRIGAGSDGDLWFPENESPEKLARSTSAGSIVEFAWPETDSKLNSITSDSDGNLWLTDANNSIWKVIPGKTSIQAKEFPLPTTSSLPASATPGSDQQIWFVEVLANKIGVVYIDGIFRDGLESN